MTGAEVAIGAAAPLAGPSAAPAAPRADTPSRQASAARVAKEVRSVMAEFVPDGRFPLEAGSAGERWELYLLRPGSGGNAAGATGRTRSTGPARPAFV